MSVTIPAHTTASAPRPHILYELHVGERVLLRRYSDFLALHTTLGDPHTLPPKRILTTAFSPSAWADDALIEERKAGLYAYLAALLADPTYAAAPALKEFLEAGEGEGVEGAAFDPEDAVPSTLSRGAALALLEQAAAKDVAPAEEGEDGSVEAQAPTQLHGTYYPDWSSGQLPPESLWFGKFDIIYFAFAMPNAQSTLAWSSSSQALMRRLVSAAKSAGKGTRVVLSVGGWGGSKYFSQACSTAANRAKFVNALVGAVNSFGLAGVDLDWEYPNSAGAGNPHGPNDAANFLTLVTALRSALGSSKIISAAVPHLPWLGANGRPLTNVAAYAKQMSWVNIMNYDVWGASSNPGPNAPLGNICGTSKQPSANAHGAIAAWTKAGWPANKLFLGLPLYGYVSRSSKTVLQGSFVLPDTIAPQSLLVAPEGEEGEFLNGAHPRSGATPVVENGDAGGEAVKESDGEVHAAASLTGWYNQQIPFGKIVSAGALKRTADGKYVGAGGFSRGWDHCSTTPFLYNIAQNTVVTYDDPVSLGEKAKWARSQGLAGTFTWSIDEDDVHNLTDAIRTAGGRAPPPAKS